MTIIQINETYGMADSTGRTSFELHQALMDMGYNSRVFACRVTDPVSSTKNVILFGNYPGRKAHALLSRATGRQAHFSRWSTRALLAKLRGLKPDIVILRVLHGNLIHFPLLMRGLREMNCGVVLVLHDCWYFTGHCWYYSKWNCFRWQKGCGNCPDRKESNLSWVFDCSSLDLREKKRLYALMPKLAVVGVSDWITGEASRSILKRAALRRIYNWIDMDVFRPKETGDLRREIGLDARPVVLGVSSFWRPEKGWADILAAAKELPEVQFVLLGKVLDEQTPPENVKCMGTISDPNVLAAYYNLADVLLNPSVQETFGKTTAEAMACGTPVVAYDTTACRELVNEQRGMLVPLGDRKGMIAAVSSVIHRGKESYSEACLAFAGDNFSKDKNIRTYLDLFQSLASG